MYRRRHRADLPVAGIINFAQAAIGAFGRGGLRQGLCSTGRLRTTWSPSWWRRRGAASSASSPSSPWCGGSSTRPASSCSIATLGVAQLVLLDAARVPQRRSGRSRVRSTVAWHRSPTRHRRRADVAAARVRPVHRRSGWFLDPHQAGPAHPRRGRRRRRRALVGDPASGVDARVGASPAASPPTRRSRSRRSRPGRRDARRRRRRRACSCGRWSSAHGRRMGRSRSSIVGGITLGDARDASSRQPERDVGVFDVFLFVVVLVWCSCRRRAGRTDGDSARGRAPSRPVPARAAPARWVRRLSHASACSPCSSRRSCPRSCGRPSQMLVWPNCCRGHGGRCRCRC